MAGSEYKFRIDNATPASLPMKRLAEYLAQLSVLFGNSDYVHFDRVDEGSAILKQWVDWSAEEEVTTRLRAISYGSGPDEAARAEKRINAMLRDDGASAQLLNQVDAQIIRFPGKETSTVEAVGPITMEGSLDGRLIRLGGRDETVPVWLENHSTTWKCNTSRGLARELAQHLFGVTLRVSGRGQWFRDEGGNWDCKQFTIKSFEPLSDAPLGEVLGQLRSIEGATWKKLHDPFGELRRLRHGDDGDASE